MEILKEIVNKLIEKHMTISTMESCTGGFVVNAITNIEGASEVLKGDIKRKTWKKMNLKRKWVLIKK